MKRQRAERYRGRRLRRIRSGRHVRPGGTGYHGRKRGLWLLAGAGIALFLTVAVLCLWVFPGARFSGWLSLALAALWALGVGLYRWASVSRRGAAVWRVFCGALAAGMVLFASVEGVLLSHGEQDSAALPADAVIVLGAGVNGETPSLILRSRIDAAADYLERHPDIPAVLSGGKGPGEAITEAEAMDRALRERGIPAERLLLEESSTSTAENFAFSKALLEERGIDTDTAVIAVVTSDFHCFRAHLIAQRAGLHVLDVPAEIPWALLNANYYVREFFALGKTLVFD